jgi:serine kinase of HPr protein (carbohydrate metabolism regulator)
MKLKDLSEKLSCEMISGNENFEELSAIDIPIENVYIGDLLSVVMAKAKEQSIWITIQTHLNVMAVAELLDIACIIVVEGMEIEDQTIKKSNDLQIPIIRTKASAYEIACKLYDLT